MSPRSENIQALLEKADVQLGKIKAEYSKSLHAKAIDATLRIDIKNLCENMRSVLDNVSFQEASGEAPPFPNETFDMVISNGVQPHSRQGKSLKRGC